MPETDPRDSAVNADAELPAAESAPEVEWEAGASATTIEAARAVAQAEDRLLRLAAEFDNYRKRTAREKTEAFDRGASALITRLLDVLDDIDRLAASDAASTSADAFRSAFELIQKKLRKDLEAAGLEPIDPAGEPFDPTLHDAVSAVAPEQPDQDHTVKATFQTGYRFKGSVVRPARVQVYSSHGVA
jgi:molecular chaperone GrpE